MGETPRVVSVETHSGRKRKSPDKRVQPGGVESYNPGGQRGTNPSEVVGPSTANIPSPGRSRIRGMGGTSGNGGYAPAATVCPWMGPGR